MQFTFVLAAAAVLISAGPARAYEYPIEIHVDDEHDIQQLYVDGEIDEEVRDRLLTLLMAPVDLNTADRDHLRELPGVTMELADAVIASRTKDGPFGGPEDLARIEGFPTEVIEQVLPFVAAIETVVSQSARAWNGGDVKLGGTWRSGSDGPGFYLRGRANAFEHGHAGILLAVRPMVGIVNSAAPGTSLSAAPEKLRFDPGALYVNWDTPTWSILGGSYRAGFGQRLTLDNSRRDAPNGFYPNLDIVEDVDAGTVKPLDGFFGVAARAKRIRAGSGWFDATVFGSIWWRDVYYTDISYDRCPADKPDCSEYSRLPTLVDEQTGTSLYCAYPTLPWFLREIVAGAHVGYTFDARNALGLTGYVGNWHMQATAKNLRPAASAVLPSDRSLWGAVGLDGKFGLGPVDAGAEVTVTDRGAPAALLRAWFEPGWGLSIVPSLRYYSPRFDNPYAHGDADADEYLGLRASDELGGRLQMTWRATNWLRLRTDVDVWHHWYAGRDCDVDADDPDNPAFCDPTDVTATGQNPSTDLEALLQAQVRPTGKERLTLQLVYRDRDLSKSGRGLSYSPYSNSKGDFSGGSRVQWFATVATRRIPRTTISAMFKQTFQDEYTLPDRFDQSWYAWIRLSANLQPGPNLLVRVKYLDESVTDDPTRASNQYCSTELKDGPLPAGIDGTCRGESYWEALVQLTQRLPFLGRGSNIKVRGSWTRYTDARSKWAYGTPCDADPSRDEFGVRAHLDVRF